MKPQGEVRADISWFTETTRLSDKDALKQTY